jgi:hypothetical protein
MTAGRTETPPFVNRACHKLLNRAKFPETVIRSALIACRPGPGDAPERRNCLIRADLQASDMYRHRETLRTRQGMSASPR